MAWTTPKTNWTSTSRLTLEDWVRIRDNTDYLYVALSRLFESEDSEVATLDDIPYDNVMAALENNLYRIYWNKVYTRSQVLLTSALPIGTFETVDWTSALNNPSYEDFNRLESLSVKLKAWADFVTGQSNVLVSGAFSAGASRVLQMFSKGR